MKIRNHIIKSTMLLSSLFMLGQVAQAVTVDIGGSIRPRVEYVDEGAQGQAVNKSKTHTTMQTRINVKATVNENVSAFIQIQDVRTWGGELGSNGAGTGAPPSLTRTGTSTSGQLDVHQAYFIVKDALGSGINLKIGRQEMVFDEARLIGNIGWIQQAQTFDAVRADTKVGGLGLTAFYAQTRAVDTHPTLSQTLVAGSLGRESHFFGARGTIGLGGKDRITAYYYGAANPTRNGTTVGSTVNVYDNLQTVGLYAAKTISGIRFRVDGAYQFGDVNPTMDVSAYMLTAAISTKLDIAEGAKIAFWADYLSGDDGTDPLTQKSFFTPYATNHKFYGHIDKFLQNPGHGLIDLVLKGTLKATPKLKFQAAAHKFIAAETNTTTGMLNDDLGSEIDIDLAYALAANTKVRMGYSHYFKGDLNPGLANNGGVTGDTGLDSNWAWLMFQMKF